METSDLKPAFPNYVKRRKLMKKIVSMVLSAVTAAAFLGSAGVDNIKDKAAAAESAYNYGEALQKSLFFYEVQQAGELPEWNQVSWRDDSMLTDYIAGGWFDAGDHLKFTLTNSYSAAMLGWGMLEYKDGVKKSGLYEQYLNNLDWALDYIARCDLGDEVVYMIGDGAFDHVWWGSAEVYENKFFSKTDFTERPYFTTKASSMTGQMAAALAVGYLVFKDEDSAKADYYLEHAINCFEIGDTSRNDEGLAAQEPYYKSSTFYDDLFWASNWLYMATGEQSYLDKAESYIPYLGKEDQSTDMKYTWGLCWDDMMQGGMLLYAINTGENQWKNHVAKHLDYWTIGAGGKQVKYTSDGLAWLFNWGSLRHATTTSFLAMVASDRLFADDTALYDRYMAFAKKQVDYCLGDNDNDFSYVVGMGDKYPKSWHHRTSSGVWDDIWGSLGQEDGKEYAHVLYGALVGGPNQDGKYNDVVSSYENSEVAIDYNAGYTAALCGLIEKNGGTSDPDFPPTETPKWDEFYIEACINQSSNTFTELKVQATNHSAWPARAIEKLSYRYFMDFTELFEAGYTVDDVSVRIGMDEFQNCTISKPVHYGDNIYYVEIAYADGTYIVPTGQSEHQGEVQFRISVPDATNFWNAENDYSFEGLKAQDLVVTDKITMYDNGKLIWGKEPYAEDIEPTEPVTEPETEPVTNPSEPETDPSNVEASLYGDVDCNGEIEVNDVVALNMYLLDIQSNVPKLTEQGLANADVEKDGLIDLSDSAKLINYLAELVPATDLGAE